jgi:serine/threonine-protein kinase
MSHQLDELTRERLSGPPLASTLVLRQHAPALALLCAGLALTVLVEQQQRVRSARAAAESFERRAAEVSTRVALAFDAPLQGLHGFRHALEQIPELRAVELTGYAQQLARDQPALSGVHFLEYVRGAERASFEARSGCRLGERVRATIHPAAERAEYLPIAVLGPWEPRELCGYDRLGPGGDNGLLKARETGQVVASIVQAPEAAEPTLSLAAAVCAHGSEQPCAAAELRGVAELWLRVAPLLQAATRDLLEEGLRIVLYDLSAPQGHHLLFSSLPGEARADTPFGAGRSTDIALADRWLRVVVQSTAGEPHTEPKLATLASGAALSLMLALLFSASRSLRSLRSRLLEARQIGPYSLEAEIGRGASGSVYLAQHALLRRPTAIKLLRRDRIDPHSLARFEREVQQTAGLCHPNTIAIYDYGHTGDDIFYYAMEYLEGIDLQRLVSHAGRQPAGRVIAILRQVCGALEEAHALGLIHRDIKPANLMLCVRGGVYDFVKVLDFGLVRNLRDPVQLQRNAFVGTPLYAAPEAYLHPELVDERADLYSLGATAFLLLTGREPFRGLRVLDVLEQHVSSTAPTFEALGVSDVPPALQELVQACMAKDPAARPASARSLRERLSALQELSPWTEEDACRAWHALSLPSPGASSPAPNRNSTQDVAFGETVVGPRPS